MDRCLAKEDGGLISFLGHGFIRDVKRFRDTNGGNPSETWAQYLERPGVVAQIQLQERFADITYPLTPYPAPALVENVEEGDLVSLDSEKYLGILDLLIPKFPSTYNDTVSCWLAIEMETHIAVLNEPTLFELFLLPILLQLNIDEEMQATSLNSTVRRQSYMLVPTKASTQVYICLTVIVLGWCVVRIGLAIGTDSDP